MLRKFQASFVLLACLVAIPAVAEEPADAGRPRRRPTSHPPALPTAPPACSRRPRSPPSRRPPRDRQWNRPRSRGPGTSTSTGTSARPWRWASARARGPTADPDGKRSVPRARRCRTGRIGRSTRTTTASPTRGCRSRTGRRSSFTRGRSTSTPAVGWMGYWFQSVGFRNYDAAWAPGLAYVALDTDFGDGDLKPNIAFTAGAWWPSFGYFEKYDTYTLGRFRQLGGQLKADGPFHFRLDVHGDGRFRDRPGRQLQPWGARLLRGHHGHRSDRLPELKVNYAKYADLAFHINTEWTADPNLTQQARWVTSPLRRPSRPISRSLASRPTCVRPTAGHLWISPSLHQRSKWLGAGQRGDRGHALAERRGHRHELHGLDRQPDRLHRQRIDDQSRLPLREHALRDPGQRAG